MNQSNRKSVCGSYPARHNKPDEELNRGKRFAIPMGRRESTVLRVGAEFFNVFNRLYYRQPATTW